MRPLIAVTLTLFLAACQTPAPVDKPCGIITDPLQSVRSMTSDGRRRIDDHFERGVAAGCWERQRNIVRKG